MIINTIKSMFSIAWAILKYPVYLCIIIFAIFAFLCFINVLYYRIVLKIPKKRGEHYRVKQPKLFKKIFILAPKRWAKDYIERDPEDFREHGLIIYTGRQGNGKTISMVRDTYMLQLEYPKSKVISNLGYKYADDELKDYKQLTNYTNGRKGVIVQIDETQNWFNSKQSKNFPPEMLQVVTQDRKNRRVIFGTAQNFYMLAKDIRSQATLVRKCFTIAGVLTIIHEVEPQINNDGEVEKMKHRRFYCFAHDETIRNAYDTYKVIETLSKSGFKERSEQYSFNNDQKITIEQKKKGILKK